MTALVLLLLSPALAGAADPTVGQTVVRQGPAVASDLSQPIHLRDVVVVGLGTDLQFLCPLQVSHDDIPGLAGGPDRDIKHRVHSLSLKYDKRSTL